MTRTDRAPRRRLDAEDRRRVILDAAARAFRDEPYEAVAVARVARAAESSEALVFRYFGSKPGLYRAVVQESLAELREAQAAANATLAAGVPTRDRVRAWLEVYLDHVAGYPRAWAAPFMATDPAAEDRRAARASDVEVLRGMLGEGAWLRDEYALWGYLGFLDSACLRWVDRGCPADERGHLVEAALGGLQGALGDWRG